MYNASTNLFFLKVPKDLEDFYFILFLLRGARGRREDNSPLEEAATAARLRRLGRRGWVEERRRGEGEGERGAAAAAGSASTESGRKGTPSWIA